MARPMRVRAALAVAAATVLAHPAAATADRLPALRVGPEVRAQRAEPSPLAAAVSAARSRIGSTYAMGAAGPRAFDCSGLTMWAFARAGIALPHNSQAQFGLGRAVARDDVRSGDLVFFSTNGPGASDVGVATGRDTAISATSSGGVMEHSISDAYWGGAYVGARRVER